MYKSSFCKVSYPEELNAVLCEWKQFCKGTDYQKPLLYGLKLINENNAKVWITDTRNGFENEKADTQWLIHDFMPKLLESSCKEIVFVIEEESLLLDEIKGQEQSLSEYFTVTFVKSLDVYKR